MKGEYEKSNPSPIITPPPQMFLSVYGYKV